MTKRYLILIGVLLLVSACGKKESKTKDTQRMETVDNKIDRPDDSPEIEALTASPTGVAPDQARPLRPRLVSIKDKAPMVLIPGGEFIYGINESALDSVLEVLQNAKLDLFDEEFSERTISIPSFYIDLYEVTNRQYARFLRETDHRTPPRWRTKLSNDPQAPVVGVGWADAEEYAEWAGKRLPSEEEWEKAARGVDGRMWPWGDTPAGKYYNGRAEGNYAPVDVGSFPEGASPYGVMDMAGNVYEMTTGTWGGYSWAMRGGSFLNAGAYTRTMFRWAMNDEVDGAPWLGFRCVMDTTMIARMATPPPTRRD